MSDGGAQILLWFTRVLATDIVARAVDVVADIAAHAVAVFVVASGATDVVVERWCGRRC